MAAVGVNLASGHPLPGMMQAASSLSVAPGPVHLLTAQAHPRQALNAEVPIGMPVPSRSISAVLEASSKAGSPARALNAAVEAAGAAQGAAWGYGAAEPQSRATGSAAPGPHDALFEYSQKLGHRVTVLEGDLAATREERDNLKAENEAIGEHIFGLQQENGMLHDIGWTSYLEKAQLAKAAEGVSTDASHLRSTVGEQKQRIEFLAAENKTLNSYIDSGKSRENQWQHQIRGLEVTLDTVQTDLQKRITREGALKERGLNIERHLEEVQANKVQLDDMVSMQHVEIAKLQQVTNDLHAERARTHGLTQKVKSQEAQLAQLHSEKTQLDAMVGTLHVEVAQLVTQRDSALTEVPQLHGTVRQQSSAVAELQEQVRNLQSQNHELHRGNVGLDGQLKEIFSAFDEAKKQNAHHERVIGTLSTERGQLKRQLEELLSHKGETDQRLNAVMSQKGIVHAHFEQVSGENNQLQLRVQQATSENAALRSRLAGMEKMVQGYQDEVANLHQRTELLRSEKEEIQEHMQQLQPQRLEGRFVAQGAL